MRRLVWCAIALSATLGSTGAIRDAAASPAKVVSHSSARQELHVTAYRMGHRSTAFIREIRDVQLPRGQVKLSLEGVPDTVQRETVHIRVLEGDPVRVLEQTFSYNVMSPAAILRAAEGSQLTLDHANAHTGKLGPVRATLIASGSGGSVLKTAQGYTFGLAAERQRFRSIPPRLSPKPTLSWHAQSSQAGKRKVELSYLVSGLRWAADYVATVSKDGRSMGLSGWVTLWNDTRVHLKDARLAVAAGTLHRVGLDRGIMAQARISLEGGGAEKAPELPEQEALSHLHLYKIATPTTLEPRSVKNVRLLSLARIPIKRRWSAQFWVHPSRNQAVRRIRPTLELEMKNDKKSNAGIPIPAGTARVMVPDKKGRGHLVATSSVKDTPEGEKLTLGMGQVGDVRYVLKQTNYKRSFTGVREATYKLLLRSGARKAGTARVDLRAGGVVQLKVKGAAVSRPSAATWRIEVPLAPGARRTIEVVARAEKPRR